MQKACPALSCPTATPMGHLATPLHPNTHPEKPPPRLPSTGGLDNTVAAQRGWECPPKPMQVALLSLGSLQRDLTPPVPQFPRLSPAGLECGIFTVLPVTGLPGPTWTTQANGPATPPLAYTGGAPPPYNCPLASGGGHWGVKSEQTSMTPGGVGSVAGHTARQWTELDRKDAGGVGDTRPPSGRGLCTETQDAHARHRSPRGDTPDPLEPHKNSTPCLALLASPGRFHHHHRPRLHPTHPPPEEDCVPRSTRRPDRDAEQS